MQQPCNQQMYQVQDLRRSQMLADEQEQVNYSEQSRWNLGTFSVFHAIIAGCLLFQVQLNSLDLCNSCFRRALTAHVAYQADRLLHSSSKNVIQTA